MKLLKGLKTTTPDSNMDARSEALPKDHPARGGGGGSGEIEFRDIGVPLGPDYSSVINPADPVNISMSGGEVYVDQATGAFIDPVSGTIITPAGGEHEGVRDYEEIFEVDEALELNELDELTQLDYDPYQEALTAIEANVDAQGILEESVSDFYTEAPIAPTTEWAQLAYREHIYSYEEYFDEMADVT